MNIKISLKEQLLDTINLLETEGIDDRAFQILNALAQGLIYCEETNIAVRALGKEIAQQIYDCNMQNAEFSVYQSDEENPRNWEKAENLRHG